MGSDKSCDSCQQNQPMHKAVRFGDISIHEFPNMLGDHPGVSSGAPLVLGRMSLRDKTTSIEEYENSRGPRRARHELASSSMEREAILLQNGYKLRDIMAAAEAVRKVQQGRLASIQQTERWGNFQMKVETIRSKMKKTFRKDKSPASLYNTSRLPLHRKN